MNQTRRCPIPGCRDPLGTTRQGDPWLLCRRHWFRVPIQKQQQLWRAYRAWQRLERQRLRMKAEHNGSVDFVPPPALLLAIAAAMSEYLDVRQDCIDAARDPDEQLELVR